MDNLSFINFILAICFAVVSAHTILYMAIKLLKKRHRYAELAKNKYAVIICARNEELVISHLIDSIKAQDYNPELIDIFVVADNCTDNTADVACRAGATVLERFNRNQIGKGYALGYFFDNMAENGGVSQFDGYFVFDADNLLDEHYITEMNKVFSNGYRAVTSYRNTKNYGDNWIASCYGIWFLRESEYANLSRSELGVSAAVSGTGFLFSSDIVAEKGGWNYHLLTEDLEFTADMIIHGEKVGYCHDAIIYDEQPTSFKESIIQRSRWTKGGMQVMFKYGKSLLREMLKKGSFSCYDMLMASIPAFTLAISSVMLNIVMFIIGVYAAPEQLGIFFVSCLTALVNSYLVLFLMAMVCVITEWRRIHAPSYKKILHTFMFPFFMLSFLLSAIVAVLGNVEWKPIKHNSAISITDMKKAGKKKRKKPIF